MPVESGKVFIMAPIAWALVGYFLAGWRQTTKTEGGAADGFVLAGILSLVLGLACLFLPATPPSGSDKVPIVEALGMLRNTDFLIFIVLSLILSGMMQFYFMGTGPFMQDIGISGKNVSAWMGMAQAAQTVATLLALGSLIDQLGYRWDLIRLVGYKWTLVVGAAAWLLMYVVYVVLPSRPMVILSQALHGIAYVTFIIAGQIYAGQCAPAAIGGSVQALIFAATSGVGLFLGTQLAGVVMDRAHRAGQFQWRSIWMVPMLIMLAGTLALSVAFQGTLPAQEKPAEEPAVVQPE